MDGVDSRPGAAGPAVAAAPSGAVPIGKGAKVVGKGGNLVLRRGGDRGGGGGGEKARGGRGAGADDGAESGSILVQGKNGDVRRGGAWWGGECS